MKLSMNKMVLGPLGALGLAAGATLSAAAPGDPGDPIAQQTKACSKASATAEVVVTHQAPSGANCTTSVAARSSCELAPTSPPEQDSQTEGLLSLLPSQTRRGVAQEELPELSLVSTTVAAQDAAAPLAQDPQESRLRRALAAHKAELAELRSQVEHQKHGQNAARLTTLKDQLAATQAQQAAELSTAKALHERLAQQSQRIAEAQAAERSLASRLTGARDALAAAQRVQSRSARSEPRAAQERAESDLARARAEMERAQRALERAERDAQRAAQEAEREVQRAAQELQRLHDREAVRADAERRAAGELRGRAGQSSDDSRLRRLEERVTELERRLGVGRGDARAPAPFAERYSLGGTRTLRGFDARGVPAPPAPTPPKAPGAPAAPRFRSFGVGGGGSGSGTGSGRGNVFFDSGDEHEGHSVHVETDDGRRVIVGTSPSPHPRVRVLRPDGKSGGVYFVSPHDDDEAHDHDDDGEHEHEHEHGDAHDAHDDGEVHEGHGGSTIRWHTLDSGGRVGLFGSSGGGGTIHLRHGDGESGAKSKVLLQGKDGKLLRLKDLEGNVLRLGGDKGIVIQNLKDLGDVRIQLEGLDLDGFEFDELDLEELELDELHFEPLQLEDFEFEGTIFEDVEFGDFSFGEVEAGELQFGDAEFGFVHVGEEGEGGEWTFFGASECGEDCQAGCCNEPECEEPVECDELEPEWVEEVEPEDSFHLNPLSDPPEISRSPVFEIGPDGLPGGLVRLTSVNSETTEELCTLVREMREEVESLRDALRELRRRVESESAGLR